MQVYVAKSSNVLLEARNLEFAWTSLDFENLDSCCFFGLFAFFFFLNTAQPKENLFASQILPIRCQFVISVLAQLPHLTGHEVKEKSDICVYLMNGSVKELKPGILTSSLFQFLFCHAVP